MKKPTLQDIADSAGVSRVSVWKVLKNQSGISKTLHYQVITAAIRLGYPLPDTIDVPDLNHTIISSEKQPTSETVISLVVARPDSSVFWMNIIHQIAREAADSGCSLMYTYVPAVIPPGYTLPAQITGKSVQGLIILNVYDPRLFTMLNALPQPKVFLDAIPGFPLDTLTGDLILLEGKETVRKITDSLFNRGRKKIGFIGNTRFALTNRLRLEGYLSSLKNHQIKFLPEFCKNEGIHSENMNAELETFLEHIPQMPDAFVCVNDLTAFSVYQYLIKKGYRVPEEITVTGYDSIPDFSELRGFMTTARINTALLGKRLLLQLMFRLENKGASYETVVIRPELLIR